MSTPVETPRVVPKWVAVVFFAGAVLLLPETVRLLVSLPRRAMADHWRFLWSGYDAVMAIVFVATGILLWRRSAWVVVVASAAGTMLLADAWFDVVSAHGATQVAMSTTLAVAFEIPLGAICFFIASRYILVFQRWVREHRA